MLLAGCVADNDTDDGPPRYQAAAMAVCIRPAGDWGFSPSRVVSASIQGDKMAVKYYAEPIHAARCESGGRQPAGVSVLREKADSLSRCNQA